MVESSVISGDLTVYPAAINLWLLVVAFGLEALLGWPDACIA
jgi:hypothetical protein